MTSTLIDDYVASLHRELPAAIADEAADGLVETYERHLAKGASEDLAARRALTEFGDPALVISEFIRQAPGRRMSRLLLATGPIVGLCWGAALISGRFWTWPVPAASRLAFGSALLVAIAVLAIAATSQRSYRRTRLATLASPVILILDAGAVSAVLLAAPALTWPLGAAVAASLTRIALIVSSLPKIAAR